MKRLALPLLLASACAVGPVPPQQDVVAVLVQGEGVRLLAPHAARLVPGTADADTFAWDADGVHLLVTHGGRLARVAPDGTRTTLLDGEAELRFPDARADGAVVVAALEPGREGAAWHLLLVERDGARVEDLGPGYDPCFTEEGDEVLFESIGDGATAIGVLDLATRARRRLAEGHTPSAAPGAVVLFSRGGHLWQLDLAAEPAVESQLTEDGDYDRFASVSPDGTRVVFFRQQDGRDSIVERELAEGLERTLLEGRVQLAAYRP